MDILLDDKTKIGSDHLNWIIYKKGKQKGDKPAKEPWQARGYFSDLPSLLHELIRADLRGVQATKLQELIDAIDLMEKRLTGRFNAYFKEK